MRFNSEETGLVHGSCRYVNDVHSQLVSPRWGCVRIAEPAQLVHDLRHETLAALCEVAIRGHHARFWVGSIGAESHLVAVAAEQDLDVDPALHRMQIWALVDYSTAPTFNGMVRYLKWSLGFVMC